MFQKNMALNLLPLTAPGTEDKVCLSCTADEDLRKLWGQSAASMTGYPEREPGCSVCISVSDVPHGERREG
ncbi:hypothetical protein FKM82_016451 [Ascaphus truei]